MLASDAEFDAELAAVYPRLLAYARILVGSSSDAQDVLQAALTRCLDRQRRMRDIDRLVPYVRRAIVHEVYRRGRRSRDLPPVDEADWRSLSDQVAEREDVRRLLLTLTPRQRVAIVNRYYVGLSEKETARAMGCTVGTVKTLSSRGLSTLRRRLHAVHEDPGVVYRYPAKQLREEGR